MNAVRGQVCSGCGRGRLRRAAVAFAVVLLALAVAAPALGATLRVPQDYATIQAAIDAAAPGDGVLVDPGTYNEHLDYHGKAITVESTAGAGATVIDGSATVSPPFVRVPIVRIDAAPGQTPVLRGFTITGQLTAPPPIFQLEFDSGIEITGGSALIENNRVVGLTVCTSAIFAQSSSATIRGNLVSGTTNPCLLAPVGGGGLLAVGGTVEIVGNVIRENGSPFGGGGITVSTGSPRVDGNIVAGNGAQSFGGGVWLSDVAGARVTNNVIVGNGAFVGGGLAFHGTGVIANNTIADNIVAIGTTKPNPQLHGAQLDVSGAAGSIRVANNILAGGTMQEAVFCDFGPVFVANDVVNAPGVRFAGSCLDPTGTNGNISAAPLFVNPAGGDYHLQPGSPAVDAGSNPDAPATDIDGDARPLDGNDDGVAVADLGADELRPSATALMSSLVGATSGVGPGTSLAAKARQAAASFAAGNTRATCAALGAFLHELRALLGKKVPAPTYAALAATTAELRMLLGCA